MQKSCVNTPLYIRTDHIELDLIYTHNMHTHMQAEVLDEDLTVTQVLEEGGYFGAKSLVYNSPMQSSVVAVTHVDVFSVSQKDFESVLLDHPNSRESIAQLAEQIYGQTMVIAHD